MCLWEVGLVCTWLVHWGSPLEAVGERNLSLGKGCLPQ